METSSPLPPDQPDPIETDDPPVEPMPEPLKPNDPLEPILPEGDPDDPNVIGPSPK